MFHARVLEHQLVLQRHRRTYDRFTGVLPAFQRQSNCLSKGKMPPDGASRIEL